MDSLNELIGRLEKAEGPDRELDAEIGAAIDQTESAQDSLPHFYAESVDAALALAGRTGLAPRPVLLAAIAGLGDRFSLKLLPLAVCAFILRALKDHPHG